MLNQPVAVQVNDFLTWESARVDAFLRDVECPPPQPCRNFMPGWYKNLRGDLTKYRSDEWRNNKTIRHCQGIQGLTRLSFTIPMPFDMTEQENVLSRRILVTEMVHGTMWDERDEQGNNLWNILAIFWPWRARVSKGYRILVTEHGLDWNPDYHTFSGATPPNHNPNPEKNGFGNMYSWEQKTDADQYNYFNIETITALRSGKTLKKDDLVFSLLILKDF